MRKKETYKEKEINEIKKLISEKPFECRNSLQKPKNKNILYKCV